MAASLDPEAEWRGEGREEKGRKGRKGILRPMLPYYGPCCPHVSHRRRHNFLLSAHLGACRYTSSQSAAQPPEVAGRLLMDDWSRPPCHA